MKKTLLTTTLLAGVASLTMSAYVQAHHPTYFIDEDLYYRIDEILSDTNSRHNEMIGDIEDYVFMGNVSQTMSGVPTDTDGDPTNQTQTVNGSTTSSMTANTTSTISGASNTNRSGPR